MSGGALSLFSGTHSGLLSTSLTFCGGFFLSGNSFLANSVFLNGAIVRHECSRSDLTLLNYHLYHEYSMDDPINAEKWLDA